MAADAVLDGRAERAVVVCGSGAGVAVAACKVPGIRAATAHDTYTAHQAVEHDDVNVLCLGARVIGPAYAAEIIAAYARRRVLAARSATCARLGKIEAIEREFAAAHEEVGRMQVIECNECGETLQAADERGAGADPRRAPRAEHDIEVDEEELTELVESEAYEAMDS